ncbi:uncharacterized protein LOC133205708 [Saccostrea echinata]|uniref:uncharacterized protein LOC133205708 n=1 Tax=Saccostrea echinata TaxID=191078 RepID=UPI002A804768|nr:uncharacterized protein LOC133205708 [Saccostrea echinata]
MLVTRITSFILLFVLLSNTEAKPTSTLRQKRAPKYFYFPRMGRSAFYFPRMGRNNVPHPNQHYPLMSRNEESQNQDLDAINMLTNNDLYGQPTPYKHNLPMGKSQILPSQGDDSMPGDICCSAGVSRVWGLKDPEPRHLCSAKKCCLGLTSKVYVASDLTVYELCVSDSAEQPLESKS